MKIGKPTPIPMSRGRRRRANYFRFYSPKYEGYLECESELELRHLIRFEANPEIIEICSQPIAISFTFDGRKLNTILDAWTRSDSGLETLWEFKMASQLIEQPCGTREPKKWHLIKSWAEENNANVQFATEEIVHRDSLLIENWQRIIPYLGPAGPVVSAGMRKQVTQSLATTPVSLAEILKTHRKLGQEGLLASVFWLIHDGTAASDLDTKQLGSTTSVWKTACQ